MATPTSERLHHLDAVRSFCMLFGLMVHGATIGEALLFDLIKEASGLFRMAAFFLVSGYFTAMVAARQPFSAYLHNRGRLILVPLAAGLLLLNPLTNWLIHWVHGSPMGLMAFLEGGWRQPVPPPAQANWHLHLWFLFSLMAYALATPLLAHAAASGPMRWIAARLDRLPGALGTVVLALATGAAIVALRAAHDVALRREELHPFSYIVSATIGYLPFFAAGVWAFADRRLFELLHRVSWIGLALFAIFYASHALWAEALPRTAERAAFWIARGGLILLIVTVMLWAARRLVTRAHPLLTRLTAGVYSFYLFHFLAIYTIAALAQALTSDVRLLFLVILGVGYPALFLLHERVIARSPLLSWLFNGKPWRGPTLSTQPK